eukprot:CAMPEP_0184010956 /NCGR_PEP_ID=MMETSP0954-20121128/3537_1 /TAXON_ID=627963 /ORGANISM="Aplanochytrium sp, Strain PBS07" /LENGTH=489 /DNA_ID=CAMNT_0026290675 /DNA_START=124 /DNA_END=1594 /DNA_ORIENTATION=+
MEDQKATGYSWLSKNLLYCRKFIGRTLRRRRNAAREIDMTSANEATFLSQAQALFESSLSLRIIFLLKFLESVAYFSTSQILTLYLSDEFGFSDVDAGLMYGVYGAIISFYGGIVFSKQVDRLGVKRSLMMGFWLSALGRGILAAFQNVYLIYISLFIFLPLSASLGIPVLLIGVKRHTTNENKTFAFGMFYTIMNVGALCCGPIIDSFTWYTPVYANRYVFALCSYISFLGCWIASSFLSENGEKKKKNDESTKEVDEKATLSQGENESSFKQLLTDPSFIRFMAISLLLTNVRSIFRHLDATLPKYLIRKHGPKVAKGFIYSINPLVIILGVPIVTSLTSQMDAYNIIVFGSYISSLSPLIVAFSDTIAGASLFVFVLSVGETLWSPRFLDYQVSASPDGREAVFMAFASAPLFLSKLPVGWFSGYFSKLIARFKASCAMSVLNGLRRTVVLTILSYLVKIHVTFVILETKVVQTPFANFVTHIDSG